MLHYQKTKQVLEMA